MDEAEFARRVTREAEAWRREGIVSAEQAAAIAARYAEGARTGGRRLLAQARGLIGAILVGIGVIVFVAANWEYIPGAARLATVFLATAAAYHFGYRLRYGGDGSGRGAFPGTGNALLFLGAMLFGAGVFLIAQGFHVNANAPSLLVLWAVGVLPMAYVLRAPAFAVLAALALSVALAWVPAFRIDTFGTLVVGYLLFGTLLYGVGRLHDGNDSAPLRPFHAAYGHLGLVLVLASLFFFTFPEFDLRRELWVDGSSDALLRLGLLAAGALLTAGVLAARAARRRSPDGVGEAGAMAGVVVGGLCLLLPGGAGDGLWPLLALVANVAMLGLLVGALAVGYRRGHAGWINIALFFFSLLVLARYFDFFWELMPRALFFVGAGVLLIVGGMALERTRRRVVDAAIENSRDEEAQP